MAVPGKPLSQNPRDHRPPPQQESLISPPREMWRTVPQVTTTANIMHLGTIQLPSPERAGGSFSSALSSCSCHYHCLVVLFREGGLFSCWVKFFTVEPGHVYPASLTAGNGDMTEASHSCAHSQRQTWPVTKPRMLRPWVSLNPPTHGG